MKIITLDDEKFDSFAKDHKYASFYQTSAYGKTMKDNGFNVHYLGIVDDSDNIIGASLIIYKDIFMGKKIAYCPRGILFDFADAVSTYEFTKKIKNLLAKQGFLMLRMDPYIPATIRNKDGKIIDINKDVNYIMKNIKSAGFKYKGKNNFFENELPRFEATVVLNKEIEEIYRNLTKRTRHKINRAASAGITVYKDTDSNIDKLYELCKNKTGLSKKYLQDLANNFSSSNVYYALLNTDSFVIEAKKRYEKEMERNDILAKKIQSKNSKNSTLNAKMESDKLITTYKNDLVLATNLLKEYPKGLIIGSALTIEYNNTSYLIIDGLKKEYSHLCSNYLLRWYIIDDCKKRGIKLFNMNAIGGIFDKKNKYHNLNEMKLGFGAIPTEYIGEFELVLSNINYAIYKNFSKDKNYKLQKDLQTRQM